VIPGFFGRLARVPHALAALSLVALAACVSGSGSSDVEAAAGASSPAGATSAGAPSALGGGVNSGAGAGGASNPGGGMTSSGGGSTALEPCTYPNWVAMKPYVAGDKVLYLGKGFVATMDNPGYDPTISTFFWSPLACQPVMGTGGAPSSGGATGGAGAPSTIACPALDRLLPNGSLSFDAMFQPPWAGHVAKSLYSYSALCSAIDSVAAFKPFANSGDLTKDKRELAAFFAHVAKETAFLEQTDEAQQASSAADYHGRGAIQITGYANYAAAGQYLGKNLTDNPGLVSTDPLTNWQSALWFWMVNYNPGTAGVQNCHQAILGGDFGQTTRIINGGIECPGSQSAKDRAQYFKNECMVVIVDPGSALVC
jgi:predicted chitinase